MKDAGALVAGLAVIVLGVLLLLDALDVLRMGFGYSAPAVLATAGVALLAFGLVRR